MVVRPSGTEPKIKTYFTTLGKDLAAAEAQKLWPRRWGLCLPDVLNRIRAALWKTAPPFSCSVQ